MELTLFSSDSSGQYKKDIYNVIAAPYNSEYRFRYRTQYVDPILHKQLKDNSLKASRALIVFRTNSDKANVEPFMVPIRWVTIKSTYYDNEICIIDFIINEYPEFKQAFKEASVSKEQNTKFSKHFFEQEGRNTKYVLNYVVDIVSRAESSFDRQEALWISVIQALKHHEPFSNTSFFRTILPSGRKKMFAKSLTIKEAQYKEIELWHFCSEETEYKISEVEIQCDTNFLNCVSGNNDRIECRYDRVNYGFQAIKAKNNLKTQIVFRIFTIDDKQTRDYDTETIIRIPVILKRKRTKRFIRAFLAFLGSACIAAFSALVSIESLGIPGWAFWLMLIVGALAAPISWLISSEE
ncbi:MAG: hypothetical protein E7440_01045 [Ruminococcaceae bacterium]|nr:hypothetical protein [Oscillospiraceae bacterium]